jgi:hypothetical protein
VIGEESESSKRNNNRWLARCEYMNSPRGVFGMNNEMAAKR